MFLRSKLLSHYVEDPETGCWNWGGVKSNHYGFLHIKPKIYLAAHRAAYLLLVGPFDPALEVCHHCDNKTCVNPKHLFVGTQKDNHWDARRKGIPVGRRHYMPRFTQEQDREIAALKEQGASISQISRRFKCSRTAIYSAIKRSKVI
jgi:hypothetical protein